MGTQKHFYKDFEDTFRGPYEVIKARLAVYQQFVAPLATHYDPCEALDLGCGRGEWLEILAAMGVQARGVDRDEEMVRCCHDRGFSVFQGDAIALLRSCPDSSLAVISGFHIAEHLPFADLQDLIQEALRALKAGGILILETPNPDNIVAASSGFFTDPTHVRPLPDRLLKFLAEYQGFARATVLRLQEVADLRSAEHVRLADVLGGASPDYGLIAQKGADPEFMGRFEESFAQERGLTTADLSARYDAYQNRRWLEVIQKVGLMEARVRDLEVYTGSFGEEIRRLEAHTVGRGETKVCVGEFAHMEQERDATCVKVDRPRGELQGLYVSKPKRVWLSSLPRRTVRPLKTLARPFVLLVMRKIVRHARIRSALLRLLSRFPRLKTRLRTLALQVPLGQNSAAGHVYGAPTGPAMSSRAAGIYARLTAMRDGNGRRGHD